MNTTQPHFDPAEALGEHLATRVRAAVQALTATAEMMTGPTALAGGFTPVAVELRRLLDVLVEQAITYDLHTGPGLAAVSAALGVSERTVRARYGGAPRDLPLLIALDER